MDFEVVGGVGIGQVLGRCCEGDRVFVRDGVYREKLLVGVAGVEIVGESRDGTVIEYDDYACKIHADGQEYNTFRTPTMTVTGDNVRLSNLTIRNTAGDPKTKGQAVALSLYATGVDVSGCRLSSLQDTLFCGPLPDDLIVRYMGFLADNQRYYEGTMLQTFKDCIIEGSVDFIFGCAHAVFDCCTIVSLYDGRQTGYVAAPAHSLKQSDGFEFLRCNFVGANDAPTCYLARPWRDFGKATFTDCRLGAHISPKLYDKWNDTNRDKTARFSHQGLTSPHRLTPAF